MKNIILICILLILGSFLNPSHAFPGFFKYYKSFSQSNPQVKNCGLCHKAPGGGGERNQFGKAFKEAGFEFTAELMNKFPQNFKSN